MRFSLLSSSRRQRDEVIHVNKEIYFVMFLIIKNSKLDNINMMSG